VGKGREESVKLVHAIDIRGPVRLYQQLKHRDRRGYGPSPWAFKPQKDGRDDVQIFFVALYLKDKDARVQPDLGMSLKKIGQLFAIRYQLSLSCAR
jgi:hypothetical protein